MWLLMIFDGWPSIPDPAGICEVRLDFFAGASLVHPTQGRIHFRLSLHFVENSSAISVQDEIRLYIANQNYAGTPITGVA